MYHPAMGRFISEDPIGFEGGINPYEYVEGKPCTFVDPYGLKLRIANKDEHEYFIGLLNTLCPDGKFVVDAATGDVSSSVKHFCDEDWECVFPGGRQKDFYVRYFKPAEENRHAVSCTCVCAAINLEDRVIRLMRTKEQGGETSIDFNEVKVGTEVTVEVQKFVGRGAIPVLGRVNPGSAPEDALYYIPDLPWIVLGHELCGHAIPKMNHPPSGPRSIRYTSRDPVIIIENKIRQEHSTPELNYGIRRHRLGG